MNLFHGGVSGLNVGALLLPNMAEHRYVEGCAHCERQRDGTWLPGEDPATPEGFVYATSDKPYARYHASRAVGGTLYRVRLHDPVEPSTEDRFASWRAPGATIVEVLERNVVLTMRERLKLFKRWGGTEREFEEMVADVVDCANGGAA